MSREQRQPGYKRTFAGELLHRVEVGQIPFIAEEMCAARGSRYYGSEALDRFPNPEESAEFKEAGRKLLRPLAAKSEPQLDRVCVPFPHIWVDVPYVGEVGRVPFGATLPSDLDEQLKFVSDCDAQKWATVSSRDTKGNPWDPAVWATERLNDPFKTWVYTTVANMRNGAIVPITSHDFGSIITDYSHEATQGNFTNIIQPVLRTGGGGYGHGDSSVDHLGTQFAKAFERFVLNNLISGVLAEFLHIVFYIASSATEQEMADALCRVESFRWLPSIPEDSITSSVKTQYGHFFKVQMIAGRPDSVMLWSYGPRTPEQLRDLIQYAQDARYNLFYGAPDNVPNVEKARRKRLGFQRPPG